ncbi:MAG TPA: DUF485 domain-containing protein [Candidatus Saccharimonadales bacterium]|nr:DUF485 domain-containing protein [Candidatus Saccharimonadales bacterium]
MATPRTADANTGQGKSKWDRVQEMEEFRLLLLAKKEFVVPTTVFFVVYYFALPVLVGYAPEFMSRKVLGPVNLAYLFALSQFFVAWGIAWAYVSAARKFDKYGVHILETLKREGYDEKQDGKRGL